VVATGRERRLTKPGERMNRLLTLFTMSVLAAGCGQGSGSSPSVCVPDQACVPATAANACKTYVTACDATSGAPSCVAATTLADGAICSTGKVCIAGLCDAACVPGVMCPPPSPGNPCKTYATACSAKFTATSCDVGGNQADGTPCGSGLLCSTGTCVPECTSGLACPPGGTEDPCKTYSTTCTSSLAQQVCAPTGNQPTTTFCNGTITCLANGTCPGALAQPTLSPPGGSGAPGLTVTVTGPDPASIVYYTTDGTAPSDAPATLSATFVGAGAVVLQATAVVQAFATLNGQRSPTVLGVYTITPPSPPPAAGVALGDGFTVGSVQTNGASTVVGSRLQLTPSADFQVASAFYPQAVNVKTFTTDFSFQLVDAVADGFTFTLQGIGPFAIGSQGGGLGYGPDPIIEGKVLRIEKSVAIKFDIFDNAGEGSNSTGIFTDGAAPTVPAEDLTPSGINLRDGHVLDVHMAYDGTLLALTITDKSTNPVATFKKDFPIDIPAHVGHVPGDVTGYVGFTAGTGNRTSSAQILNWTYSNVK
jgi:hypothetical protein